jgi:hypothetical protein
MSDFLELLDRAQAAHRQQTVDATVALLTDLLDRNREVSDISIKPGAGAVMVTLDDATIRLVMPSAGQALALRELWQSGPVTLAMGIALDDGRAMLGFSGADEDVLVSTRVSLAA